jgi:hypothetical protein
MSGPTLVDCACEARVHADGSGIEIDFCPLHDAAPDLLKALQDIVREGDVERDIPFDEWDSVERARELLLKTKLGAP